MALHRSEILDAFSALSELKFGVKQKLMSSPPIDPLSSDYDPLDISMNSDFLGEGSAIVRFVREVVERVLSPLMSFFVNKDLFWKLFRNI